MVKCAKCGEEKKESEGKYVLEGTAFRCNDCESKEKKTDNTCEFC